MSANEYYKERREWLRSRHMCTYCGKEKAEPGKQRCFECAEKINAKAREYHKRTSEQKNERCKERYNRLKEQGVCVRCAKRPVENGKVHCSLCLAHFRIRDEKKRREEGRLPNYMRGDGYHCAICGRDTEKAGDKLCPACLERNRKNAEIARSYANRSNHWWSRDNSRIFGGECDEKKRHDGAC